MKKKQLGRSGLEVSVIGLGGGSLGFPTPQSVFDQYGSNPDRKAYSEEIEIREEFWDELFPLIQDFSFVCQ